MATYYKCECCNKITEEDDIETVNDNTGASDGTVDICPHCEATEMLSLVADLDWNYENREEARLDAMYEARYADSEG